LVLRNASAAAAGRPSAIARRASAIGRPARRDAASRSQPAATASGSAVLPRRSLVSVRGADGPTEPDPARGPTTAARRPLTLVAAGAVSNAATIRHSDVTPSPPFA